MYICDVYKYVYIYVHVYKVDRWIDRYIDRSTAVARHACKRKDI